MKDTVVAAVNEQINAELESAYLYLAMSASMQRKNLPGLAQWLRLQWEEELVHALKFYDFLLQRDAPVELTQLPKPEVNFESALQAFEAVLEHEQYITGRISDLYDLSVKEKDYPLQSLLKWYIDEQVEEEDNARAAIDALRLVEGSGPGLFLFDREMGVRKRGAGASAPA
jgi:ferritin